MRLSGEDSCAVCSTSKSMASSFSSAKWSDFQ
ncbi:Uncharacterised protein [Mycobacterium tuberculosis]|uniref:Uncharacterized protein n=1 Tax=Mycobacterium tuberculosis TaxID=1773 RepID=A0A655IFU7_MYCTX|nr:Uncharacterised protein [Mycobacterium tuberculosis]COV82839.1 Uncharacterised protein [Mycobacterium tuberculosis]COW69833.1 Uncharacterised protein [Mycobacterium tuberculosis]COY59458.1 Uncharacterised protein [Mycobacterium tuberculosis]COZ60332.1 Uncharacterised protein [Mycobacterium tuberculosis]